MREWSKEGGGPGAVRRHGVRGPRGRGARLLSALLALAACAGAPAVPTRSVHHGAEPAAGAKKVLVLHGTRAGSTTEVADHIGKKLAEAGFSVDVEAVAPGRDLAGYQAVVIGSAVRAGSVLPEIRDFVKARRAELSRVPVAYFVVCMAMREDTPEQRAKAQGYVEPLRAVVQPVEVGLFAGKVDYAKLSGGAKLMAKVAGLPEGDFRDWAAIGAWADALASRLGQAPGTRAP
jgi:menaquinone-dependent protoporphyrinogen oxidase